MNKIANNHFHKDNTHLNTLISKRKKLALVITPLLMVTALGHPITSYAIGSKSYKNPSYSGNSGNSADDKITICHVPPGETDNAQTITLSINSLKNGHLQEDHHLHNLDYIGSCKPPKESPIHIVSGCTGSHRTALNDKVIAYYKAITVDLNNALNALFNSSTSAKAETLLSAMSYCLNSDKGNGTDSVVTLNGITYHNVIGCQNNNTSYRTNLVNADSAYDTLQGLIDPLIVPVNSLDDSAVWSDYKTCAYTNGLIDPAKSSYKQGDIGHKYHLVRCDTTAHKNLLLVDIDAYIAKPSTNDIILTQYSIDNDSSLEQAVDDCGGGYQLGGDEIGGGYYPAKGVAGRLNWKEINIPN